MDLNSNNFAGDVIIEILSKLPVKSLLRFKCIARSWSTLVKDPTLISKHLKNYNNENNILLYVTYIDFVCEPEDRSVLFHDPTLAYSTYEVMDPQLFTPQRTLGPYEGLYCLYCRTNNRIALWNPATREMRVLPRIRTSLPRNTTISYCNIGFELDHETNDYKLVVICDLWDGKEYLPFLFSHIFIYTLSTNYWRELIAEDLACYSDIQLPTESTYLNRVCYWLASQRELDQVILSFHMEREVFQKMHVPEGVVGSRHNALALSNDSQSLHLSNVIDYFFGLWETKEGSIWTKKLTIGPLPEIREFVGLWKENAFFIESADQKFCLYDPNSQELKDLKLKSRGIEVHRYCESLIRITQEDTLLDFFEIPWDVLEVSQTNED